MFKNRCTKTLFRSRRRIWSFLGGVQILTPVAPRVSNNGPCSVQPIQFFNFLDKWKKQIWLNLTVCIHFQLTVINLKIRNSSFMANKDIFESDFPFFRFPKQSKKWNIFVSILCFSIFALLIKNEKTENWHLVHWNSYFPTFGKKWKNHSFVNFFVTFSIFWQIGEMSWIFLNILFWF